MTFTESAGRMDQYLEVVPGFRVIPESPVYAIRAGHEDGYLVHGDGSRTSFTVVNRLCSPTEMDIFDHDVLIKRIIAGFNRKMIHSEIVSVEFDSQRTGVVGR